MLTTQQFPYALRLIGALASDIHEMHTLREHIETLPKKVQGVIKQEVLNIYSFDASGFGEGHEDAFLDQMHTALGIPHLDIVRDLKRWYVVKDPRLADPENEVNVYGYGHARNRREPVLV